MSTLSTELRNRLAKAIQAARREAEAGARRALEALAVHHHEPHGSMSPGERKLRQRLRAHGRQLGDTRDRTRGTQEIGRLTHEVAYEHWHRMLFARFLAENHLLIEPESRVPISMSECEELARESGEDSWALASRFAQRMLPRIFRPNDPGLEVALAPETRQALEHHLASLPAEVFTSDDALGWTYQFWQAEKKEQVNKSGVKIGADELPAVTQLFTEHYMVLFLFHNTIGAWWAGKILAERPELTHTAESENELRDAARLGAQSGYEFDYLRFVRKPSEDDTEGNPTGPWRPAAGTFEGWPKTAAQLRVLDPCCGSGHFLVAGFELLTRLRMEEESLALEDAIRAVLSNNLFGLELDPRCTQIAAFSVALAAWKLAGRPIELPPLHIACSGLAPNATKDAWLAMAEEAAAVGGMPVKRDLFRTEHTLLSSSLREGLSALYNLFEQAPELGSLIDPRAVKADLFQANFATLQPLLGAVLERERASEEETERAVAARGMAHAAELLAGEYTLVITNVPYLGRGAQTNLLKAFADQHHREARADLATVFVSRILYWLGGSGTTAVVTPQNWLFLTSYRKLREKLLAARTWNLVARLGPGAFETIGGHVVNVTLNVVSAEKASDETLMGGIDASGGQAPVEKAAMLRGDAAPPAAGTRSSQTPMDRERTEGSPDEEEIVVSDESPVTADGSVGLVLQANQLKNPDASILLVAGRRVALLRDYARSYQGLTTGDDPKWKRAFWEVPGLAREWRPLQSPSEGRGPFAGRHNIVSSDLLASSAHTGAIRGRQAWGKRGVAIDRIGSLAAAYYDGDLFHSLVPAIVPHSQEDVPAIVAFCFSNDFQRIARNQNQALSIDNGYFEKLPFDLSHWRRVAIATFPNGVPEPHSDDPSQWLFHGHPAKAEPETALQVAVARILGYRWPPEHDREMHLAEDARECIEACRQLPLADRDGIACLTALRGEASAADRLRRLLAAAFGTGWSAAKERELLAAVNGEGTPSGSLDEWLRDRFFEEHCKLFHQRPFIWHIWDGRKDGFHALLNYHRLAAPDGEGRRTLEALAYSYLGDWIERQKAEQRDGNEGADARLAAAQDLQAQLERILFGESPCDLFVRWKPLSLQSIGWEPDINDGVRFNIRPFLSVELRTGGRKGAGILRWRPSINWRKDRGQEPRNLRPSEDFPWFWGLRGDGPLEMRTDFLGGHEFDGNRWNDLHYTNAVKRVARSARQDLPATLGGHPC